MHHADAVRLEIVVALPFPVRVDEELYAGILVDVSAEMHFAGGGALLKHIVSEHKICARVESAQHHAGFVRGRFRPIHTVEYYRFALCHSKKESGRIIRIDVYTFDYHNIAFN